MKILFFLVILIAKSLKMNFFMKQKDNFKLLKQTHKPKTENQQKYHNILSLDKDMLISVIGPPGTGKTCLACVKAIEKLKENKIDKIIITRPIVSVGEENLGFLPGNIEMKMDPWIRPILDIFLEYYSKTELKNLLLNDQLEISPLGFMRGRTFKNSFIIADEMQNSSPNQMLMLLTRIGENSKIIITGDLNQSDLKNINGLLDLVNKFEKIQIPENFYLIKLNETDIQRSNLVNKVLKLYNTEININTNHKNTNITNTNTKLEIKNNGNNDAALIPLHHMRRCEHFFNNFNGFL